MRTALLLIAASIVGTACFHESRPYDRDRYDSARLQRFEAYTTDGESVLVEEAPRTGVILDGLKPSSGTVASLRRPNSRRSRPTSSSSIRRCLSRSRCWPSLSSCPRGSALPGHRRCSTGSLALFGPGDSDAVQVQNSWNSLRSSQENEVEAAG